ncbi:MAG: hypothetical protein KAR07_12740 [Spirochaetes bacterium]|nr:hypothetical protein [Spirochaetota bacterium]MCK5269039.1 hypothetical protein [Spirochaetota bacterium]
MAFINLNDSDDKISKIIDENSIVKCPLLALNSHGKNRIKFFIDEVLKKFNAEHLLDDIFLSIMELCFNAVKANYMYVTVLDKIREMLHYKAERVSLDTIWESQYMMTMYTTYIQHPDIKDKVKDIIKGESKIFNINEKAEKENRSLTEEEKQIINDKTSMINRTIRDKVKATLSISTTESRLIIDVINDAPITSDSIKRIESKRKKFLKYYKEDKIGEFFMENLDESESAGFGAAMIDSRLLSWGMEPAKHFKVLGLNKKTCATLTIVI